MSALRILHIVPYYEHAWAYGGIPRLVTTMTRGLAARGHRVTVCTTDACDSRSRVSAAGESHGVDVRMFRNISNRLAYHYQLFTPLGLHRFLQTHVAEFDIAHLHACRNLPVEVAARVLIKNSVPYVLSPNGTAPRIERRFFAKRVFDLLAGQQMFDSASLILAVSEAERRQLLELGAPDQKIRIAPNPIEEAEFDPHTDPDRFRRTYRLGTIPIVLFLGKLTPRKGVDVLIRAFEKVRDPTALVIAGNDMGAAPGVRQLVGQLGLSNRVSFVGLLKGRERLDALAAATVVVYPSKDEVFGLVPVEALMCSTPVVVCNDSGCGEVVATVGGGLLVRYGDAAQLASAVGAVLDSPASWRARARDAGTRIRKDFGARRVCTELEALYQGVLAQLNENLPAFTRARQRFGAA